MAGFSGYSSGAPSGKLPTSWTNTGPAPPGGWMAADGYDMTGNADGGVTYGQPKAPTAPPAAPAPKAPSIPSMGGGGGLAASGMFGSDMSGGGAVGGIDGGTSGAKVAMPEPVAPSMEALQGGGGAMEQGGGTESLGAPSQFRQGIGKRLYPQESAALAALRKVY